MEPDRTTSTTPVGAQNGPIVLTSVSAQRVLVMSAEPLGEQMAGPAIRVRALERTLAEAGHQVVAADPASAASIQIGEIDVAVVQGGALRALPELSASDTPIVVDLYDPFHLEALHRGADDEIRQLDLLEGSLATLAAQIARGDFFLCASRTQRHLWLGHLAAAGRLNPATHGDDPTFHALLALAPFGVDDAPFAPTGELTQHIPAATGSPTLLWAGGLHDWLDPITVIEAMPAIRDVHPTAQLILLGGRHPNQRLEPMAMVGKAKHRAADLGLLDGAVIIHEEWITNAERADLLNDADLGVLAQSDHAETEFAFRTRLLDHIWAGLPTVSTMGDDLSRELAVHGAGRMVPPADPDSFAAACLELLEPTKNADVATNTKARAQHHRWSQALAPLLAFVDAPRTAPDRENPATARLIANISGSSWRDQSGALARAQRHLDVGGAKHLAEKSFEVARQRLSDLRG